MPHSPASRIGWWTDCGPCSTRLRGWSTLPVEPSTWHRSSVICTGFDIPIGSTTSWRCWSTDASMDWRRATSPTNSRVCRRFESRRNLRSASTANLVVPRFQRKILGGHAFPVAAAQAWNSLPSHVTSSSSLASFKRNLKTELFLRSYVQSWYRLMLHVVFWLCYVPSKSTLIYVTLIIFVIIIIIIKFNSGD